MIAYCPPGQKALAELLLVLSGEYVDEVVETQFLERDVLLVADPPELLIEPVFTVDRRAAESFALELMYRIPVGTPTTICLIGATA